MITYSNINKEIFKNLLSENELNFIEQVDSILENTDNLIENEQANIDLTNTFIKNINNISDDSQESSNISVEAKKILGLINQNIQFLESTKRLFSLFQQYIMDLNVEIEENEILGNEREQEIQTLKGKIRQLSEIYENYKSNISSNDFEVSSFLSKKAVKEISSEPSKNISSEENLLNLNIDSEKLKNNNTLLISEKSNMVFLPYSEKELAEYLKQYPTQYSSYKDVIEQEFINPFDFYQRHTVIARFREAYSLIRDKESKSILDAFKYSIDLMFNYKLHPAIIAACKTQEQLENYLDCLEKNKLDEFKDFEIKYEIMPFAKKNLKNPIF